MGHNRAQDPAIPVSNPGHRPLLILLSDTVRDDRVIGCPIHDVTICARLSRLPIQRDIEHTKPDDERYCFDNLEHRVPRTRVRSESPKRGCDAEKCKSDEGCFESARLSFHIRFEADNSEAERQREHGQAENH